MNATDGVWLSITDYSSYKKVSISTIRRHIKNNILKHKEENGKYYIYTASSEKVKMREDEEIMRIKFEIELLRTKVRHLREENNELRMLVEVYENDSQKTVLVKENPPEIPAII